MKTVSSSQAWRPSAQACRGWRHGPPCHQPAVQPELMTMDKSLESVNALRKSMKLKPWKALLPEKFIRPGPHDEERCNGCYLHPGRLPGMLGAASDLVARIFLLVFNYSKPSNRGIASHPPPPINL